MPHPQPKWRYIGNPSYRTSLNSVGSVKIPFERTTPSTPRSWTCGSSPSPTGPRTTSCRALVGPPGSRAWSFHACRDLRPRRVQQVLAVSHLLVLPSAFRYGVGTLIFENYAAQYPTRMCPCQRFTCSLATDHAHDSGSVWIAGPSPYGSFIRTSTPAYPGAHPNISSIRTSSMITCSNSLSRGSGMPHQVDGVLLPTMSGTELSRVRTEL